MPRSSIRDAFGQLLRHVFPGVSWPWWRDPRFRRHAGPDLIAAATCALLLLPLWAYSSFAQGLADAVALQAILAFVDLPLVFVVAIVAPPRAPRWLGVAGITLAYGAVSAGFLWLALQAQALSLPFVLLFLLPIALRAKVLVNAINDGENATTLSILSICTLIPWVLSLILVAEPLGTGFGLQTPTPGSDSMTLLAPAWNAMGVLYFTLVALMRWSAALQAVARPAT